MAVISLKPIEMNLPCGVLTVAPANFPKYNLVPFGIVWYSLATCTVASVTTSLLS